MKTLSARQQRLLRISLIVVGLGLTVFFGVKSLRSFLHLHWAGVHGEVSPEEELRGWMTIPYVARVYAVPEEYLFEMSGIAAAGHGDSSLHDLAGQYFPDEPKALSRRLRDAIQQYRAAHPAGKAAS